MGVDESENAAKALEAVHDAETDLDAANDRQTRAADKAAKALDVQIKSLHALEDANEVAALKAAKEAEVLEAIKLLQPHADTRRRLLTMERLLREIELS